MKKVIIIGGGPAGLMAAIGSVESGADVFLYEKRDRPARKLLITGKGRCNITNQADLHEFIENIPGNGAFLYSAFNKFNNYDLIDFFEKNGVTMKLERGGRYFPESDKAVDVVDTLIKCAKQKGVKIILNTAVKNIIIKDKNAVGVVLENENKVLADAVIVATGGKSYPLTGSTGDGYKMAEEIGHKVVSPKPSLVPLITKEKWVKDLMGLSLRNVSVEFRTVDGRKLYEEFGEMLFTHFGVSGPVIISASRHLLDIFYDKDKVKNAQTILYIDLKPALTPEKLDDRLQRDFLKHSNKIFCNALDELLPQKMIPVFVKLSGINPEKKVNQISKAERQGLVDLLKRFKLTIIGFRPIDEAIVTAGGVATEEINPSTMQSKLVKGLYFAGELIDVDGYTGGFNLQIAFSTGYLAGLNATQ